LRTKKFSFLCWAEKNINVYLLFSKKEKKSLLFTIFQVLKTTFGGKTLSFGGYKSPTVAVLGFHRIEKPNFNLIKIYRFVEKKNYF